MFVSLTTVAKPRTLHLGFLPLTSVFRFGVVFVGAYGGLSVTAEGFSLLSFPASYFSAGAAYSILTCGKDKETVNVHNSSHHENERQ
jgi:hypothetical protein